MAALYDLKADPDENRNLAAAPEHADLVRSMHRRLIEVMKADGAATTLPADPLASGE